MDAINGHRSGAYKPLQVELKTVEKALEGVEAKKSKWYKLFEADGIEQEMLLNPLILRGTAADDYDLGEP